MIIAILPAAVCTEGSILLANPVKRRTAGEPPAEFGRNAKLRRPAKRALA
jgi:hypothetical protein